MMRGEEAGVRKGNDFNVTLFVVEMEQYLIPLRSERAFSFQILLK